MAIGLVLLVTADPTTIHQISHTLHELSLSPDLCGGEAPAAIRLLNRRKFDAVIVDLQLGEPSGAILDEVRLSSSNRTAVTLRLIRPPRKLMTTNACSDPMHMPVARGTERNQVPF